MDDEHRTNPVDAAREGLEELERAPHHATTQHDKGPEAAGTPAPEPPGERHRGGPLPFLKR